ncbi:hypothetical protein B0H14DRAFT_2574642 [Mycena olivaceomarginata]|nr:hypothetical protein B0H14DRAFT_2574642 [Mycena olivaceomarginata]
MPLSTRVGIPAEQTAFARQDSSPTNENEPSPSISVSPANLAPAPATDSGTRWSTRKRKQREDLPDLAVDLELFETCQSLDISVPSTTYGSSWLYIPPFSGLSFLRCLHLSDSAMGRYPDSAVNSQDG